jgi:acyl-CoA synthetase (NDP forming)
MSNMRAASVRPRARTSIRTLRRIFDPQVVAVAGASDNKPNAGIESMIAAGARVHLINPNRTHAFGQPCLPALADLPEPADVVFSLLGMQGSVEAARAAKCGGAAGIVLLAADPGPDDLCALTGLSDENFAVLGPNSNGYANIGAGTLLTGAPPMAIRAGDISIVSHAGGLIAPIANGLVARNVGANLIVSPGNETIIDIADTLDFLVDDDRTSVITLILEQIRRPNAFFAAARRAMRAGKPIVALKMGRSERARQIASSHTGAIAGEPWVYDAAFRQFGIVMARDLPDLLDLSSMLSQTGSRRWRPIRTLGIVTTSGGMAELASDICGEEGMDLPPLLHLGDRVAAVVARSGAPPSPGATINPLDTGGALAARDDLLAETIDLFGGAGQAGDIDALLFAWMTDEGAAAAVRPIARPLRQLGERWNAPVILASVEDGEFGNWTREEDPAHLQLGRGLRAAIRGLKAIDQFAQAAERMRQEHAPPMIASLPCPPASSWVQSSIGSMLSFGAAMELLETFGVPLAPYWLLAPDAPPQCPPFAGPYVLKLADVPHRTELKAVRFGVLEETFANAVAELRAIATRLSVRATIAAQQMLSFDGAAFIGGQPHSTLGPMVLAGPGGTMVELFGRGAARLAPFDQSEAAQMIGEIDPRITGGFRGSQAWDTAQLADVVMAVGNLVLACRNWMSSIDINPLLLTAQGFTAVDCLIIAGRPEQSHD